MNVKNVKDSVMGRFLRKKVVDGSLNTKSSRDPDIIQSTEQLETHKNQAITSRSRLWSV